MQSLPYCSTYNIENSFSLFIQQNTTSARIKMLLLKDPINTSDIPHTVNILKTFLPSVLTTECFNDASLPFSQEVSKTEIGHLFEHILLEYMCQLKISKGYKSAVYAGRTRWNWKRDPRGMFHIHINCTLKDADILPLALEKSITLTKIILQNNHRAILPLPTDSYLGLKNGKNSTVPLPNRQSKR